MNERNFAMTNREANQSYTAILGNGRVVWLNIRPRPADQQKLQSLVDQLEHTRTRMQRKLRTLQNQSHKLSKAVKLGHRKLGRRLEKDRKSLSKKIAAGDETLARKMDSTLIKRRGVLERQEIEKNKLVKGMAWRHMADQLVLASALPLMAAYGQRKNPFAPNNLVIFASLILWLAGDDITHLISGRGKKGVKRIDLWSALAPAANLLGGWWMLSDSQHERFITGITGDFQLLPAVQSRLPMLVVLRADANLNNTDSTDNTDSPSDAATDDRTAGDEAGTRLPREGDMRTSTQTYRAIVDLSQMIASDALEDFVHYDGPPALASIHSVTFNTSANNQPVGSDYDESAMQPQIERITAAVDGQYLVIDVIVTLTAGVTTGLPWIDNMEASFVVDTQQPGEH